MHDQKLIEQLQALVPFDIKGEIQNRGEDLLRSIEGVIEEASEVEGGPFYAGEQFEWVERIENNWEVIREELDAVLQDREKIPYFHKIQEDQTRIAGDEKWRTFFMYGYGYKSVGNCERAPKTSALLESIPGMTTAMFSILSPGKVIPAHRGPYKGVLRYHLGLQVPEKKENCRIRVGEEWRHWEEGKSLIFDDTRDHEVHNDTDEQRVVLFVDVLRPMPPVWDMMNRALVKAIAMSPYVRDAMDKQEEWELQHFGETKGTETMSIWEV